MQAIRLRLINGTIGGLRVTALDGTETFGTQSPTAGIIQRCERRLSNGVDEYYERATALSYVGAKPRLIVGMERIAPGETEVQASTRLLGKAEQRNCRYCGIVYADALYAQAPFIDAVSAHGKWVVIKVKQENYHLVRDMDGLMAGCLPEV